MRDSWVSYFRTLSRWNLSRFYGRAQKVLGSIRRVRFTKATQHHANIQRSVARNSSSQSSSTAHSPFALKFEDRSQEDWKTSEMRPRRCVEPSNEWCFLTPSVMKLVRKRVRCRFRSIGANVEQERLELCRMEVRVSESPTTVVVANGEVQTKRRSDRVCQGIGFFRALTRKILRRSRIFIQVHKRSESTTHQRWQTDKMQHGEPLTDRCTWFISRLFKLSCTYISDTSTAESSNSHSASRINKKWEYERHSTVKPVAWKRRNRKHKQKCRQRDRSWKPVAWSARMITRIHGEFCGWKCSSSWGRTREFFS